MKYALLIIGKKILLFLFAATLLLSCGNPYEKSKKKRAEIAKIGKGDIALAVVWPQHTPAFLFPEGIDLAVQQINEKGGVLGRELRTIYFEEPIRLEKEFDADKIASNSEIVAVLGHYYSDSTLSALISYEYQGILLLIGGATNPLLLEQGFEYVFRPIPNDRVIGGQLAQYAHRTGYKRIAIIDDNTLYGKGLADNFYQKATDLGLQVVIHRGYFQWHSDFRPLIAQFSEMKLDAILLAGILPQAGMLIKQMRQIGVTAPLIGGDGLDSQELITVAGQAADGTVVPNIFRPLFSSPAYMKFREAFQKKYKKDPDHYAAIGYDTVNLLDFVMNKSKTAVPFVVASTLRHTKDWKGLIGNYAFEKNGELTERKIYFKQVRHGKFVEIKE